MNKTTSRWQVTNTGYVLERDGVIVGTVTDRSSVFGGFGVRYQGLDGKGHTGTMPFETAKQAKAWVVGHLKRELRSRARDAA